MSSEWHWFVIAGVVLSLVAMLALMFGNRKTSGQKTTGHSWDGIEELDNPLPMWWVGLFVGSIAFAIPFLLFYPGLGNFAGFGGWSSASQHDRAIAARAERFAPLYAQLGALSEHQLHDDPRARQVGRRLFINNCSTCHGVNAAGSFGFPDLTDGSWIWGDGFTAVKTAITKGRQAAMPAWGVPLGEDGTVNMTQYVLKLAGQPHSNEQAAAATSNYATFCAACHGEGGHGNPALGAPDLTDNRWLYGGTAHQIHFTITHGRTGNMPAHEDLLDANRIHILAGYVTGLQASETAVR